MKQIDREIQAEYVMEICPPTVNCIVSCYSCGQSPALHIIREMSKRCGYHLCDKCYEDERIKNRAMHDLCS